MLVGEVKDKLEGVIREVAQERGIEILTLEIQPDHLYLFVSSRPQLSAYKLVKTLKGRSSSYLRWEFPSLLNLPSLWTNNFFVSTADVSPETIRKYIEVQGKE